MKPQLRSGVSDLNGCMLNFPTRSVPHGLVRR